MKNINIKAALFDLDGVVVFTDKYHYLAWKKLSDEQGWDFDETVNNRLRGIPRMASLEEILRHNHLELPLCEKEKLIQQKNDYYVELLQQINEADIYPGAVEFIEKLRERGTKISLCSSSKNAPLVLEKLGLTHLFDAVVTGADIQNAKPDPEIFRLGADRLKVPAFHCVVFEDSKAGIVGAKAAKMKCVGVGNREEVEDIADQFISAYDEIDVDTFLESGRKKPLPVDETKMVELGFNRNDLHHMESIFALGNGYMGLRGTYDETDEEMETCPGIYLNGVFATKEYHHFHNCVGFSKQDEFTVNLTDWRIFNLYVDGEKACFSANNIREHRRELDMRGGWIDRSFVFETASGKRVLVKSCRIVNMFSVHSAQIRYTITPLNFSGQIVVESQIIKLTETEGQTTGFVREEYVDEAGYSYVQEIATTQQCVAAAFTHHVEGENYKIATFNDKNVYRYQVSAEVCEGESLSVEKYAAFGCYLDEETEMLTNAEKLTQENCKIGFEALKQRQAEFWNKHWELGDIVIEGNPADQQAVRFSLFELRQQLPAVNQCSIGATGLTGPGYSGKVFWDTEMYLMPYYNYTNPESQKELLMYRYKILDKARERAKKFGTVGAMYSWCSIDGEETSIVFEASTAEYHLGSDIAYAVWRYCDSTKDKEFLYQYGAEIVFDTARFLAHRGRFIPERDGRFCINVVCGPDEYACGVSNNMYTNLMVQFHLRYGLQIAEDMKQNAPEKYEELATRLSLTEEELSLWKEASDKMYYKYNEKLGIHEQDDSFIYKDPVDMERIPKNVDIRWEYHPLDLWRMQVSKQADVCLLNFIQGNRFTYEEKLRNYEYYEPKCNHGSSLSTAIYAIMAAELGKKEAYEFFRCSAYMDISDFKHNTADGLHMACLGGVWMTVVNGFLGLRHYPGGIQFRPRIPAEWTRYCLPFVYGKSQIEVQVDHQQARFVLKSKEAFTFSIEGQKITLDENCKEYVLDISRYCI